jgi:hypothetical protein
VSATADAKGRPQRGQAGPASGLMLLQHRRQKKGIGSSVKFAPQVSHSTGMTTCKSCRMIAAGLSMLPRDKFGRGLAGCSSCKEFCGRCQSFDYPAPGGRGLLRIDAERGMGAVEASML